MGDKQIEYSVFCIENVAKQLGKTGSELFQILNASGLLHSYIIPSYDRGNLNFGKGFYTT